MLEEEEPRPAQTKTSSCAQVFTRRNKGIVIKDPSVVKDLASELAKANQVIASQRQEIIALSIKAHQDPNIEIIEPTLEDVGQTTALVLATLSPDAKPLNQQPLLDT
uniref:Uncharacterized protein n=1 Tax=Fagus sylvatica TaxID=28930 RepID=A0A2N9JAE2_FAGSY